ncbi:MAG: CopG family ribbon-helix-helix protein [Acidianus infernus]|uniref:CopG family ribbon-helix-helix protein n=1 Tax=Acidianus infernus TaxID=12915 RepID=UPI002273F40A|nr:CopG family ribbon-helix-helix protein [Acidianus infernus]MCY0883201.1 CopG family ribbon-helix-helix protein [Acidianus infernus]
MNVEKISVSIPKDIMEQLDKFMKTSSSLDRSKIFQIAIKNFLDENSLEDVDVVGIINIVYDDEVTDEITKLQHEKLSSIISTLHIHLNEGECMEAIAVKGKKSDLVKLTSSLSQIKGVKKAKLLTYEVKEK